MVRLINQNNMFILDGLVRFLTHSQKHITFMRSYNQSNIEPCVYALWHEHQLAVYGLPNKGNVNILISNSMDGQIVANVAKSFGFKTCRGSSKRKGSVSSTLHMIEKLKSGEDVAIMVDGPRGPYHEVKPGIVMLSKESGAPIIPVYWYSKDITLVKIPSWDKMSFPCGPCRILTLFGDPIYTKDKSDEQVLKEVKNSLVNLEQIAPEKFDEAIKNKLWNQKQ